MNIVTANYTNSKGVSSVVTIVEVNSNGRDTYITYIDASGDLHRDTLTMTPVSAGFPFQLGTSIINKGSVNIVKVFDSVSVSGSGNTESDVIDMTNYNPDGFFSLHLELTGDGTAKVEFLLSNSGSDHLTPSSAEDIVTAHIKTSGPGSDGKDIYSFSPDLTKEMIIKITEMTTTDSITVNGWLAVQ
jgi:hypothetical protein